MVSFFFELRRVPHVLEIYRCIYNLLYHTCEKTVGVYIRLYHMYQSMKVIYDTWSFFTDICLYNLPNIDSFLQTSRWRTDVKVLKCCTICVSWCWEYIKYSTTCLGRRRVNINPQVSVRRPLSNAQSRQLLSRALVPKDELTSFPLLLEGDGGLCSTSFHKAFLFVGSVTIHLKHGWWATYNRRLARLLWRSSNEFARWSRLETTKKEKVIWYVTWCWWCAILEGNFQLVIKSRAFDWCGLSNDARHGHKSTWNFAFTTSSRDE